ncbi:hypothetical protein [Enterococcus casseliflavus]|uniref:hypothetical protein n=1 Tax=Enterococcus casseliflavus TaxID=37734 RepID=UPI0025428606|nr:hypothetical protein [Enterococcus casseliflavus]MDK4450053.1 hypothetical protein [Enterococcus casseliflavus]
MSRIQMQLSRPTLLAFREYKRLIYGDSDINATNGYVLGVALKNILSEISSTDSIDNLDKIDNIPWVEISKAEIPNVTNSTDNEIVRTKTTLTMEKEVDDALVLLQNEFKNLFETSRIYKAFVVKMIMFAAIKKRIK